MTSHPLDWHLPVWNRVTGSIDRLPHALLLTGPRGVGKTRFASALAARLLCEQPGTDGFACGRCHGCNWFAAGNHPDFRLLVPGGEEAEPSEGEGAETAARKKSDQIVIEQIRDLEDFVNMGSHRHGRRVVAIRPAEAMNQAAANALLKMLEEPAPSVLFLLVSDAPRRLLPTIRSRCQTLPLVKPSRREAEAWLAPQQVEEGAVLLDRLGGSPLAAQATAGSALAGQWKLFLDDLCEMAASGSLAPAGRWETQLRQGQEAGLDKPMLVGWLQKWVYDLLALKLAGAPRYYTAEAARLGAIAGPASAPALAECYNDLLRVRAVARHPLNPRLFLEDLFARYLKGVAPGREHRG